MRRIGLVLFSLALLACPKPPPPRVVAVKVVDPLEAAGEVLKTLYAGVQAGDADKLEPLFTSDALVFGLGPSDTWQGGTVVGDRVRQALLPIGLSGDTVKVEDARPVIALSPGGESAWAFDLPRVTTTRKGKAEVWLPRLTLHLERAGEGWRIDALHLSLPVADAVVFAPDANKKLLAPADVSNERTGKDADQLVGLVRRSLDDYGVKVDRTCERAEFVQVGTSASEVLLGGKSFKELLKPQLGAIKRTYSWKLDGNLRVKLAPGGKSGWAAGLVVQRQLSGKKAQVLPSFRVLWTLVEEDGLWNISSEHQSLALKEELREGATDEQLKAWKATRELAEKTAAKSKASPHPKKKDGEADIGAW